MRILHAVLSDHFHGSEHYCAQLAALQGEAGDEVFVLLRAGSSHQVAQFRAILGMARVHTIPAWARSPLDLWFIRGALRRLMPSIVHVHLGRAASRVGRLARRRGIPVVASLHLTYKARQYRHCDGLICVAAWQLPTLDGADPFPGLKTVVRNWVPAVRSPDAAEPPSPGIVLGSVGRLDAQKGYDILIPAFQAAFPLAASPEVSLVLVGEGPHRARLAGLAKGDPRIRLVGYQTDVPAWLARFDGFVSASRFEGLALVVLEAIAVGLPLLVTDVAGNVELAGLQAPGLIPVVPADDVEAMAAGLGALAGRIAEAKRGGDRGRLVYDLTALDRRTAAARVGRVYADLLRRKSAG